MGTCGRAVDWLRVSSQEALLRWHVQVRWQAAGGSGGGGGGRRTCSRRRLRSAADGWLGRELSWGSQGTEAPAPRPGAAQTTSTRRRTRPHLLEPH